MSERAASAARSHLKSSNACLWTRGSPAYYHEHVLSSESKAMTMRFLSTMLAAAVLGLAGGCGAPGPDALGQTASGPEPFAGTAPAPGTMTARPPEPVVYQGEGDPFALQLLHDGGFEKLSVGTASRELAFSEANTWVAGGERAATDAVARIAAEIDSGGHHAVALADPQHPVNLSQLTSTVDMPAGGAEFAARVWGRASRNNELALVIRFHALGQEHRYLAIHPGDGMWRELKLNGRVPPEAGEAAFVFEIARRPGSEEPVLVDNASLRLARSEGDAESAACLVGRELLRNGTFDEAYFGTEAAPHWQVVAWGGNSNRDVTAREAPAAPERHFVLEFPTLESGTVAVSQDVTGIDESVCGTELLAKVWARTSVPRNVALKVTYSLHGIEESLRGVHPGDGDWHEILARAPIPQDGHPTSVRLIVLCYGRDEEEPALADNASLMFVQPVDSGQ